MESEFNPDQLKPFDKVHEADPRHDAFSRFDQNETKKRAIGDDMFSLSGLKAKLVHQNSPKSFFQ